MVVPNLVRRREPTARLILVSVAPGSRLSAATATFSPILAPACPTLALTPRADKRHQYSGTHLLRIDVVPAPVSGVVNSGRLVPAAGAGIGAAVNVVKSNQVHKYSKNTIVPIPREPDVVIDGEVLWPAPRFGVGCG